MPPARELWVDPMLLPGGAVVALRGELDLATSPLLRTALAELIGQPSVRCVVVDMGGVTFIDSTGVHVLVEAARRLRRCGGDLTLSGTKPGAFKVLDIRGLTSVFGFVDDPLSAVREGELT